jgi:CheY-like chemotaxis protein
MVKRVLVVDDDFTTCLLVKKMLADLGFGCELASNGDEAVQAVSASHFDIVLMDIFMPVMNGLDASIAIQSSAFSDSERPAIYGLISGEETIMRAQCIEAGMEDILMKPIDRLTLREILNRCTVPCASMDCINPNDEATKVNAASDSDNAVHQYAAISPTSVQYRCRSRKMKGRRSFPSHLQQPPTNGTRIRRSYRRRRPSPHSWRWPSPPRSSRISRCVPQSRRRSRCARW